VATICIVYTLTTVYKYMTSLQVIGSILDKMRMCTEDTLYGILVRQVYTTNLMAQTVRTEYYELIP